MVTDSTNKQTATQKAAVFCFAVYESIPNQTAQDRINNRKAAKQKPNGKERKTAENKPDGKIKEIRQEIKQNGKIKRLFTLWPCH